VSPVAVDEAIGRKHASGPYALPLAPTYQIRFQDKISGDALSGYSREIGVSQVSGTGPEGMVTHIVS
jgi:hypothetical protein